MSSGSFNHFPHLQQRLHTAMRHAVVTAATQTAVAAQDHAPVRTGFMQSAIYLQADGASTYGQGLTGAGTLEPEAPQPADDLTAHVVAGADYSIYVEMGTRFMAAQPWLAPAAEDVRPRLARIYQDAIARWLGH